LDIIENLRKEVHDSNHKNRQEMLKQLDLVNQQLSKGMIESSRTIQSQFKSSQETIQEVTKTLTKLQETNSQVKGFADQLQSLEGILKNPKQRGILGEYFLETLLSNTFTPDQYKLQYKFPSGDIVDAAIFYKDRIIPVDSKFSLEKYNQIMEEQDKERRARLEKEFKSDVKKRIDETSKYIRPQDNTTDFAFMFIPAEGIFYNLLIYKQGSVEVNSTDLVEYAFGKKVIITSPTSFFAYLQTVMQGMRSAEMEKNVQDVIKRVGDLGRHLNSYQSYMQKLGNHLGTTVNMYTQASNEYSKIDKDVVKITNGESSINPKLETVEKPDQSLFAK
ncbi:DNA recombination protein RmuC, partial [Candidatus Peregrinibacteria bacterium]|nr:DNA recombination protein RmuC [Candidatus Peregrinibacteria bacterium]